MTLWTFDFDCGTCGKRHAAPAFLDIAFATDQRASWLKNLPRYVSNIGPIYSTERED